MIIKQKARCNSALTPSSEHPSSYSQSTPELGVTVGQEGSPTQQDNNTYCVCCCSDVQLLRVRSSGHLRRSNTPRNVQSKPLLQRGT